jgi:hypothetical protein
VRRILISSKRMHRRCARANAYSVPVCSLGVANVRGDFMEKYIEAATTDQTT